MFKKFIGIMMCMAVVAGISSGCADKKTDSSEESSRQELTYASYPSGKFEFAEALKNIRIGGQTISIPCTFGELGDSFTLGEAHPVEGEGYSLYDLSVNDVAIGYIALMDDDSKEDKDKSVYHLMLEKNFIDNISIYGVGYDSDIETYVEHMGEPSIQTDTFLEYSDDEGVVSIVFNEITSRPCLYIISLDPDNNT